MLVPLFLLAASIEGTLTNALTGAPVRKADVVVGTVDGVAVKRAVTDSNGHYLVPGLPAGSYRLAAGRVGFLPVLAPEIVVLSLQEVRAGVNIAMSVPAVITGHVFDADGEPVERVRVVALRQEKQKAVRAGEGETNDLGEYRIAGLVPGSFALSTATSAAGAGQVYGPVYYPETVTVAEGGEAQGLDLRVRKVAAGTLMGVVHQPPGQFASVRVAQSGTKAVMTALVERELTVLPDGRFTVAGLAPGRYTVTARLEHSGILYWAEQEVTLNSGALTNAELTLRVRIDLEKPRNP